MNLTIKTNFLDSKDKSYDVGNTASAHIQVKLGGTLSISSQS